jgi:thiamine-phosphate pyrophosphorylase
MQSSTASHIQIMQKMAKAMGGGLPKLGKFNTALPSLILLTDDVRLPNPIPAANEMPARSAVLFRHYDAPNRYELASELADVCREKNLLLWIGCDLALAKSVGAHGLHLPEFMARRARPMVPREMTVTAAAHSYAAIRCAEVIGADAVLVSPIFPSQSHPHRQALGPLKFRQLVDQSNLPTYALGGIGLTNAKKLAGSGGAGIAAIGSLSGNKP